MEHTITSEAIESYAENFTSSESPFLEALNKKTQAEISGAQMLSGHLQGWFLKMVSRMIRPKHILEIGTYTGYSATCLADGLQADGLLHTIDIDPSLQPVRNDFWNKEGLDKAIFQHIGAAVDIIPTLSETFELVFIDADKKNYGTYFDLVLDKVPSGGWLLTDNTLFHGEVVLPKEQQSKAARAIHLFNEKIASDDRVEQVLIPMRDGITLIQKR